MRRLADGREGTHVTFNACNVNGHVVWVDMQTNTVGDAPINTGAAAVWATVLDSQERPVP